MMNNVRKVMVYLMLTCAIAAQAQLTVTVSPPKVIGQKALVELRLKNRLSADVKSARAVCFLLNERGRIVGQSTKWVIGGAKNRPVLKPKQETTFNFVIPAQGTMATNLAAKVSFTRVILASGEVADPNNDVIIELPKKPSKKELKREPTKIK